MDVTCPQCSAAIEVTEFPLETKKESSESIMKDVAIFVVAFLGFSYLRYYLEKTENDKEKMRSEKKEKLTK